MSLVQPQPLALLCLPCAGASAGMYLRWRRALPRWMRLVPVELPGRGVRMSETFATDFDELVDRLCEEHERQCDGRYALYGHSMGALIAYGMAMRMQDLSRSLPQALFVSASPAPSCRDPSYFANKDSDAALIAELRKQAGTPEAVFEDPDMRQITLNTLRADYRICASYRYRPAPLLPTPIHVFAGREDEIAAERILAWQAETSSRFSAHWFEGGHFFIRQQEAAVLGAVVRHLSGEASEVPDESAVSA